MVLRQQAERRGAGRAPGRKGGRVQTRPASVLLKSAAICLNVRPFSKTSQMVSWFTAEFGLVTTPVKGAQRPKSGFVGAYDVGYTCEVVFYAHVRSGGTHHIRECVPTGIREGLRARWRPAVAAAYACDLTLRTAQPGLANGRLFRALEALLDCLEGVSEREVPLALLWYESVLLGVLGLAPDFSRCAQCPPAPRHLFSLEEGHFVCEHRRSRQERPETLLLHDEIPELFGTFLSRSLEEVLAEARASDRRDLFGRPEPFPGVFGLRRFLGIFLNAHLEVLPGPRRTALDLLI